MRELAKFVTFGSSNINLLLKNGAGSEHGVSSIRSLPRYRSGGGPAGLAGR
jgi:hypothetical protein